jgi:hypothetical protein
MTITVNLKGRLGNQLFQYATLRNISIVKDYKFYINTKLEWQGQSNLLPFFNIQNSEPPIRINHRYSQPNTSNYFDENIYNIEDDTILDGHFENIEYFKENKEIIQKELTIKDKTINEYTDKYIDDITKDGSKLVGIHFRRGDLVQQVDDIDNFNKNTKQFVRESLETISKMEENVTILLFTGGERKMGSQNNWIKNTHEDDVSWVENLVSEYKSKYKIEISPGTYKNNELMDYCLLSKCDYMITPHQSTFSFMAYYVNTKIIQLFSPTKLYGMK